MKNRNFVGGVIVLVLGIVFLLANLGYTNINVGRLIATWWPLILIVVGARMLLRGRSAG